MSFNIEAFMKELENPSAIMRTAPLWVWNDTMTDSQIDFALDELKSHGFGGAIIHPRPGMVITYLSPEWFKQWGYALEGAKKREMKLYIYDENSYPSGFGGGHVSAELPDCLGTSVRYTLVPKEELLIENKKEKWFESSSAIKVFACEKAEQDGIRLIKDLTDMPREEWMQEADLFAVMEFVKAETAGWLAGFANVDLLRREVTDMFIKKVYEPYFEHFGEEFGKTIPAIFMDEPALTGSGVYGTAGGNVLPFSYWFSHEFYKRNGYYIEDYLPALFIDTQAQWFEHSDKKVRYDYYDTTRALWVDNFMVPLSSWCENHEIALTGHFMEDDWPRAGAQTTSPNIMANFEFMGWPAIDMLVNNKLLEKPNEQVGIIMQELRSAVNEFGQERCFCEAFGAGGWDSTLADFKRVGDWLMVNGVNFINEHLTYTSYLGARKRDHPQSFDWRQPWWEQYTKLNDYFGRVCAMLSQGHMEQRILFMHPTSTGYMRVMDDEASNLVVDDIMAAEPDMRPYLEALQQMIDDQWDFDLGNEDIMKRHGKVTADKIQIKNQTYQLILITKEMKNMFSSTVSLLKQYLDNGGSVISLGTPGGYVDGKADTKIAEDLCSHKNWIKVKNPKELSEKTKEFVENRMVVEHPFETGIEHMRRVLDSNYAVYFFVNHGLSESSNAVTLQGEEVTYLDLWEGIPKKYPFTSKNNKITFNLNLERYESAMFLVKRASDIILDTSKTFSEETNHNEDFPEGLCALKNKVKEMKRAAVRCSEITPTSYNTLLIEYCDLELDKKKYKDMCTIFAGKEIYKHRGFQDNPWDNQVQYKRRYLDQDSYGENTGFEASYHFEVRDIPGICELVIEQGKKYEVTINGAVVNWKEGYYLDEKSTIGDIAEHLISGTNTVVLKNKKFDVRLELEPIYIRGDFAVWDINNKWTIVSKKKLEPGNWVDQGYPLYEGAVEYCYLYVKEKEQEVLAEIAPMETTCASLYVNNAEIGLIGVNGNYIFDISKYTTIGENQIVVRVCGGFKNLLGPHHCKDKPRKTAWPDMWRKSPKYGRPDAKEYDLISYGMKEDIKIYAR